MSNPNQTISHQPGAQRADGGPQPDRRPVQRSSETKASFKTTELIAYVVAVVGVLLASYLVKDTPDGRADYFTAERAWFYVVLLTIGYLVSRGLAKSGSREPQDAS